MLPNDIIAKIVMAMPLRDQFAIALICFKKNELMQFIQRQYYIKMADISQEIAQVGSSWFEKIPNNMIFNFATILYNLPDKLPKQGYYKFDTWKKLYDQGFVSEYDMKIENTIVTKDIIMSIILYLKPSKDEEEIDLDIEIESWLHIDNSSYIKGDFSYTINKNCKDIVLFESLVSDLYWPPDDRFKLTFEKGFVSSLDPVPTVKIIIPKEFLHNLF